jgi:protocatechuate 3,4-dioxygenase beta subunit
VSARTLAVSTAILGVLYLGWLGWKDVLIPPPFMVTEAGRPGHPIPPGGAVDAAPPAGRVSASSGIAPALRPPSGNAVPEADPADANAAASPGRLAPVHTPEIERAGSDVSRSSGTRPPGAPDPGAAPPKDAEKERDRPRSRLALGGWVLDRDGHGVDGLPVQARPRRLFASLDESAAVSVAEHRAVTDAGGRFAFEPVADGDYELRTDETELYERATVLVRAGADSAVLVVEAKAGRSLFVHGAVESTRGGPLAGVRVDVIGQPRLATVSDDTGSYGLRLPVSARLQEAALRFVRKGYRELRLPIGAGETPDAADVVRDARLEPTGVLASVSGLVAGDNGRPVSRASVQLYSAGRGRRYQSVSDTSGRFVLAGVEESDDYRLWVHPQAGYRDYVRESVEVSGQGATLEVTVEALGSASLRGTMIDPEGRFLPGFTLSLRSAYGSGGVPIAITGDAQGAFALRDLPEGPVALETRAAPQLAVTGISLAPGVEREVLLPLDVGSYRLEGSLRAENGAPVGGARVSLYWTRDGGGVASRSFRETVADAAGSFVFTQLGAGIHTLSVTAAGFRSARVEQPVGSGTPPVEIKLSSNP